VLCTNAAALVSQCKTDSRPICLRILRARLTDARAASVIEKGPGAERRHSGRLHRGARNVLLPWRCGKPGSIDRNQFVILLKGALGHIQKIDPAKPRLKMRLATHGRSTLPERNRTRPREADPTRSSRGPRLNADSVTRRVVAHRPEFNAPATGLVGGALEEPSERR